MGIKRAGESLCSLMQILKFMSDRHLKICDPGPSKGRDHADPDPAKHLDKFMQEHEQVHGHKTIQVSNWLGPLNPSGVCRMQQCNISWDDRGECMSARCNF